MKNQLKKIIHEEYEGLLPSDIETKVSKAVFKSILKPKPWYQLLRKEDILLATVLTLFVIFAYFIGFDSDNQLSISLSRDLQKSFGIAICTISVGIYLFLNEYFEGKKNIIQ